MVVLSAGRNDFSARGGLLLYPTLRTVYTDSIIPRKEREYQEKWIIISRVAEKRKWNHQQCMASKTQIDKYVNRAYNDFLSQREPARVIRFLFLYIRN
jgi:hypothetical protein